MKWSAGAALLAAGFAGIVAACDDGPPAGPAPAPPIVWTAERTRAAEAHAARLAALESAPPGELRVHLGFGPEADLDLYVTAPDEETVYYANSPSRLGGVLVEDRRCSHDGPRSESVRFPAPLAPGRYRVGVDYPHACDDTKAPAPFAVRVDEPGGGTVVRGQARYQLFDPVVLEFEIPQEVQR